MTNKPSILITGINGYLGQFIAEECKTKNTQIIGTGRQKSIHADKFRIADLLEFTPDDLLDGIDIVIHSAAIVPTLGQMRNFDDNVTITRNLAEACIAKKIKHFIYISSASIYAKSETPHKETSKLQPSDEYGKSKLACEELLQQYQSNMRITILRLGTVFGPQMSDSNNIQRLISAIGSGRFIQLGNAQNQKSLLYVEDAARACAHVALTLEPTKSNKVSIYNISPPPLKMDNIIAAICTGLGRKRPFALPTSLVELAILLSSPISLVSRKFAGIQNSIKKYLSNDALDGSRFTSETNFKFQSDISKCLVKICQKSKKIN